MMRLPPFRFHLPASCSDAAKILKGEEGEVRLVAGGTDLWPNMKRRHQHADHVVALRRVRELYGVSGDPSRGVRIGAMTTLSDVARDPLIAKHYPMLRRAVLSISSPVLRNMGTLGGNLCLDTRCTYYNQNEEWRKSIDYCMKEVGSVCWVAPGSSRCWAISASDSAPHLCAIGARVRLVSSEGERVIPLPELYQDDGIAYLTKRPDEILTEVLLPPAGESESSYWKLRRRGSIDFSVLTATSAVKRDDKGVVLDAKIYLGAVTSYPALCEEAGAALLGQTLTEERIAAAARAARRTATPLHNTDYIPQWRSKMVEHYVAATLREIAGMEPERLPPKHAF